MNFSFSNRRLWAGILFGLLVANVAVYWPRTGKAGDPARRPPGLEGDGSPEAVRARFEAALENLPDAQRKEAQERLAADRAFFESVKDLTEAERREKVREHFAQNPPLPIPGLENMRPPLNRNGSTGGGPGGNSGGPPVPPGGGPGRNRLPEPSERRKMDRQIADSQNTSKS